MVEESERKKRAKLKPISQETIFLWNLYQAKQQGYPFGKDDLPMQTWYDFAIVESVINELKAEAIKNG